MQNIIDDAKSYIKIIFENDYSGHDYFHSLRVYDIARKLAEKEEADIKIVSLAALLHDVDEMIGNCRRRRMRIKKMRLNF